MTKTNDRTHAHIPETTLTLQASWLGFPCAVSYEIRDACHGQASVSIFYTLDFIRSVPYPGGGKNNAKDEKYVRITVNPQGTSGAGWHLVDQPTQTYKSNGIFYSDTEWFGPFVMAYGVKIYPDNAQTHLLQHIPRNRNVKQQIREHTGITVGVDVGAKLAAGFEGTNAGVEAKGSFSYTSNRWVIYDTYEYDLINKSSGNTAEWSWDRQYDINHRHWLYNPSNVWAPTDASILFDTAKFSPAAYANFTPGFSAIYSTDAQNHPDSTTFILENHAHISALQATLTPKLFFSQVSKINHMYRNKPGCQDPYNWSLCSDPVMVKKAFEINWHAAAFEPQAHVSIEAYKTFSEQGLCLTAPVSISQNQPVTLEDCNHQNNQLWGLDKNQRYLSRQVDPASSKDKFCLSANIDGHVIVQRCNSSAQQKWKWENDRLINEVFSELTLTQDKQLTVDANGEGVNQWHNYPRQINPDNLMYVHY
jgi:hemolysin